MRGTARSLIDGNPRPRPASYMSDLREAYRAFFTGNATPGQQEAILVDLFSFVGYYGTTTPKASSTEELWFAEGQRSVGARMMSLGNPAEAEINILAQAVRAETLALEEMNTNG